MLALNFSPFPVIETERLILRADGMQDVPLLFRMRSDDDMRRYTIRPKPKAETEVAELMEKIMEGVCTNTAISWAITLKGKDTMIGNVSFWRIYPEHHRAEIGYMLWKEHWGKGIITEAVGAALDYGFRVMKLHSVEAQVSPGNEASVRLLKKHGFVQEAYFHENVFFEGKYLDTLVMSKLNPEQK